MVERRLERPQGSRGQVHALLDMHTNSVKGVGAHQCLDPLGDESAVDLVGRATKRRIKRWTDPSLG